MSVGVDWVGCVSCVCVCGHVHWGDSPRRSKAICWSILPHFERKFMCSARWVVGMEVS